MRVWFVVALMLVTLVGCGTPSAPTPDLVATQIAVEEAAHATMTARAPTATNTALPTAIPTDTATSVPTDTPLPTDSPTPVPTETPVPTSTPTETPLPTFSPSPAPSATPTPEPKPTEKPTNPPVPTSKPATLDQYRVYYSHFEGTTIAENEHPTNFHIWSMRGDGQEATPILSKAQAPDLSDDGTKLAYIQPAGGVFVLDLTTGQSLHVVSHNSAWTPTFSPGGHRLSYAEYTVVTWWDIFQANSQVHIVNADGSGDTTAVVGRRPAWSPTSNLILYEACVGNNCGVMVLNADNGQTRLVVAKSAGKASWSHDGQTITYTTDEDGDSELWSINLDGSGDRRLTDNNSTDALAAWSPDGKYIYFLSDRKDGWGIWVMEPDGSNPRKVKSIGVPQYWQWAKMVVGWNR